MATNRSSRAQPSSTDSRKSTGCGLDVAVLDYEPQAAPIVKSKEALISQVPVVNIVGVDPGLKGGICRNGHPVPMPIKDDELDVRRIASYFSDADLVCVEQQGYRPGQGGVVTNLCNYGILLGVARLHAKHVLVVSPQRWKNDVLGEDYAHDKAGTILWANETYPKVNLTLPKCRKPHDGMADALAIWHYAKGFHE